MTLSSEVWASARAQWDTVTVKPRWRDQARPEQLPPADWSTIYFRGGRGSGKTRSSAEAFAELIEANPADDENGNEWAVVAPTFADARDVCIEGPSGLIAALGGKSSGGRLFEKGPLISSWNRSMGQLYLNDGTVIYADGADDGALRVQGKNLRGAWCLAKGEPVHTRRGTIPVEQVRVGDEVMTRSGWRRVTAARRTGRARKVLRIVTPDGSVRVTPDHVVWADGGWIQAANVTPGSTMTRWTLRAAPQLGTSGKASAGIAARAATTQTEPVACCTSPSGNASTASGSPKISSSITSTTTLETISPRTFAPSPVPSTWRSTARVQSTHPRCARSLAMHSGPRGRTGSPGGSPVPTALPSSYRPGSGRGSVSLPALRPSVVTSVEPSGRSDVYDLTIEGAHEFFAAGLLIHNCDEIGLWKRWRTAWDESIKYAVRKFPAKRIVSGTPKRNMPAIELVRRLLKDFRVVNRKLRTEDNAANLDPVALAELMEAKGTALGGQELEGDVLDEAEGALWTRDPAKADAEKLGLILTERATISDDTATLTFADRTVTLARRVVALDPAEGEGDEQGRTVAAMGSDRRYYVLHAAGEHLSPMGWLRASETVFDRYRADRLIYEKNGAMFLKPLLEQEFPRLPAEMVHASQGKRTRAEPIAALYARRLVTHVILPGEDLGPLEAQMTSFTGDPGEESPGMIDSCVYAISHLHSRARPARSTSVADMRI